MSKIMCSFCVCVCVCVCVYVSIVELWNISTGCQVLNTNVKNFFDL